MSGEGYGKHEAVENVEPVEDTSWLKVLINVRTRGWGGAGVKGEKNGERKLARKSKP